MQPPLPAFAKKKRFHTPILSPADLAKRRASKRIVRQFLDGNDTTFSNHSLRLLRRYIQARYSHALRKDPKHAQFTPKESAEIKKAHLWVVMGLEPNLKKPQIDAILRTEESICKRATPKDVNEEIDWILKGKEKNKADLFGKTRMVLDDLNFEDLNPPKGTLLRYTGLAGRDKILLSKRADMQELGAAAAHELGHKRYGLEEPLGYALSYAYQYANGILERKELIELLGEEQSMQNKDHNSIKGLEIVIDASRYGNRWNDYFWKRVRSLARKPVFQWKKQPLKTR